MNTLSFFGGGLNSLEFFTCSPPDSLRFGSAGRRRDMLHTVQTPSRPGLGQNLLRKLENITYPDAAGKETEEAYCQAQSAVDILVCEAEQNKREGRIYRVWEQCGAQAILGVPYTAALRAPFYHRAV